MCLEHFSRQSLNLSFPPAGTPQFVCIHLNSVLIAPSSAMNLKKLNCKVGKLCLLTENRIFTNDEMVMTQD